MRPQGERVFFFIFVRAGTSNNAGTEMCLLAKLVVLAVNSPAEWSK